MSETRYHLTEEKLALLLKNSDVEQLSRTQIAEIIRSEPGIPDYKPEPYIRIDPRDGIKIVYNAARASRPHDNEAPPRSIGGEEDLNKEPNFITNAKTTSVIDVAPLSEGFTFINFNLFPALYPHTESPGNGGTAGDHATEKPNGAQDRGSRTMSASTTGGRTNAPPVNEDHYGMHFLQWSSSYQDRDWHNMPDSDCTIVLSRIAALEKTLLAEKEGYVSIFKNCGRLVGGSIAQGHQQIGFSTVIPRSAELLEAFKEREGIEFSSYMLTHNPTDLRIRDYGKVELLIPYCMRRPYTMMLIVKDTKKQHLYEVSEEEMNQLARGWKTGIRIMRSMLSFIGKPIAYNIAGHTGPGAGIFFDFLPYTQETGGFEHLGLYVCQNTPELCAANIKTYVREEL